MAIYVRKENGELESYKIVGLKGEDGKTPNIQIGEVATVNSNEQAAVTRKGTNEEPIFDFSIPRGESGVYVGRKDDAPLSANIVIDDSDEGLAIGGDSNEKEWRLISDITIEEDVASIFIDKINDDEFFEFDEIQIIAYFPAFESGGYGYFNVGGENIIVTFRKTSEQYAVFNFTRLANNQTTCEYISAINKNTYGFSSSFSKIHGDSNTNKINKIKFNAGSTFSQYFPIGTNMQIYGR